MPPLPCRRHPVLALAAVAVCLAAALAGAPAEAGAGAGAGGPRYRDARAPVDERVADLLRRMTLDEKIGQMTQIAVAKLQGDCGETGGGELNERCLAAVLRDRAVGSVLSGGGNGPPVNTPRDWARMVDALQRYAVEHSRLGVPLLYGVDAVHGHNNVLGATVLPHQIGLAATWDPELVRACAGATARAVAATGVDWTFAPVADLARDRRWGRYYETFGEDPLLAGALAAAAVRGTENAGGAKNVAATVKHFAGYSEPSNGHDRVPADVSPRYLQDTLLAPYRAAVEAGARTVMVNSGALNGVPVTASRHLLTTVLRERWGFTGVTVSDWQDVRALWTAYKLAADYPHAAALAVNAGVDMAMEPYEAGEFTDALRTAVRAGLVPAGRIDEAAGRVLRLKFTLGLFERPYVDAERANTEVLGAGRELARRAAAASQVLLRNDKGVLPFGPSVKKIVVTGALADDLAAQAGGWTVGWQGLPDGVRIPGTTVLEGIRQAAPTGTRVVHATAPADAVTQARDADATVVVVGERPGAEGGADSPRPELPTDQRVLVRSLKETGRPVVVVVLAGRPLVLGDADGTEGLLMSWLPGGEGGHAVADVLFGAVGPSGRLPVSWPRRTGNEPLYYQQLPGTNAGAESGHDVAYDFGDGLSYTGYRVESIALDAPSVPAGTDVGMTVRVGDTGPRDGEMILPVYVSRPVGDVLSPPRRLVAFTKVRLKAGETRSVRLTVPSKVLAVTPGDIDGAGPPRVEPGPYVFGAGARTATLEITRSPGEGARP
ncbi:glycoside hydrolase family 3 N-terminal domain-containing protein [Streptomyces sp. UNOB3_S3]|uniref:glycoside hydrolase family 3 N-terminal domain-containing protein n=1 Tax=Streptomyces sp. UNOB3_S3 TaxID=2871682 RepID=UPI001E305575|nr:glycoside hydrolase family 3 N-terminal domain-containing protein [Streptomyces sp. UNOB3_S3]MCC3776380.1 glycoside hydrolase family 3 C-terminal domain-containing protein [Streptomyces sp. UNOB3_S3]